MTDPIEDINAELDGVNDALLPGAGDAAGEASLEDVWNQGRDLEEKGEPEGTFNVLIEKAVLGKSSGSGRMQIVYTLRVAAPHASAGIELRKYDGLGSAKQAQITRSQLTALGVNLQGVSVDQLPAVLLDLQGKVAQVLGKKNGQFYNINFQRLVDVEAAGISAEGLLAAGDEAPF